MLHRGIFFWRAHLSSVQDDFAFRELEGIINHDYDTIVPYWPQRLYLLDRLIVVLVVLPFKKEYSLNFLRLY